MSGQENLELSGYAEFLAALKNQIRESQIRAAISVNHELVLLYWKIGRDILDRQRTSGWGAKVIDLLARDLRAAFPEMKGFSPRNLKYMRAFAQTYPDLQFVQQAAAQIPWFHNCVVMDKVQDQKEREWYIRQSFQNGWSRNILVMQIESGLYRRQGRAVTNFDRTLPPATSDLAQAALKDPYVFDFLTVGQEAHERDIERELVRHIRDFLIELGTGFAFVGQQYRLEVGGEEFSIDLLFYHLRLRRFVAIELKSGEFKPEYAGKLNFYLSAIDDLLRHPTDEPSVGLVLCRAQNQLIAEYAIKDMNKPIGVSTYELTRALPEELQGTLPTIEELEATLNDPKRDRD